MAPSRIQVHGEEVDLLSERAVFWPRRSTLLVADLHWGKSETFRATGIPVPDGVLEADLTRLGQALSRTQAKRLVVLGDLVHAPSGVTSDMVAQVAAWRLQYPVSMTLVMGNHDRKMKDWPKSWGIEVSQVPLYEPPFVFCHEPQSFSEGYVWAGHVHPMLRLNKSGDALRLPCFYVSEHRGLLPAFSLFTGGSNVYPKPGERCFVIAEGQVIGV